MARTLKIAVLGGLVAFGPCDGSHLVDAPRPGPIPVGTWGGNNAGAIVTDSGAHVHIGCTAGDAGQPLVTDSSGRFSVSGRYNITLYPVARLPDHPARYFGSVVGRLMTLSIALTDTAVTLGPVELVLGQDPRMGPCPICRRPPSDRAGRSAKRS